MARTREVYPTQEIAHLWAYQTQTSARNQQGNFYFEGPTIYSYGTHFPIAMLIDGRGRHESERAVLFTTRKYSNITAKHLGLVRYSIPASMPVFYCHNPALGVNSAWAEKDEEATSLVKKLALSAKIVGMPVEKFKLKLRELELMLQVYSWHPAGTTLEPAKVLAGKNLCMRLLSEKSWEVLHIASKKSIGAQMSQVHARALVEEMDKYKAWNSIGEDGKFDSPETRDKLALLVSRARMKAYGIEERRELRQPARVYKLWYGAENAIASANQFNEFFGFKQRHKIPDWVTEALQGIVDQYAEKCAQKMQERTAARLERSRRRVELYEQKRAENEEKEKERKAKAAEFIERWRAGENYGGEYGDRLFQGLPTMLRIVGEEVETSMGARFPVQHAATGLVYVKKCRATGVGYTRSLRDTGRTIRLGHFTVDSIDADGTVHAGCHVVPWPEIEKIAPELEKLPWLKEWAKLVCADTRVDEQGGNHGDDRLPETGAGSAG